MHILYNITLITLFKNKGSNSQYFSLTSHPQMLTPSSLIFFTSAHSAIMCHLDLDQFNDHSKPVLLSEAVEIYLFSSTLADNSQLEYGGKGVRSFYKRHFFF